MDALESAFNKRVRQLQRAAQKSTGAKKMKRLMACSIFALYPVIAVCAPDTNAISKAQTFDELKNAYKNAAEQVITEYESQGVDSFEIVSARTQYQ